LFLLLFFRLHLLFDPSGKTPAFRDHGRR